MNTDWCPICRGLGRVVDKFEQKGNTSFRLPPRTCHRCGGRGWVNMLDKLEKLTPQQKEIYNQIIGLREKIGRIDFEIVKTLREMRE